VWFVSSLRLLSLIFGFLVGCFYFMYQPLFPFTHSALTAPLLYFPRPLPCRSSFPPLQRPSGKADSSVQYHISALNAAFPSGKSTTKGWGLTVGTSKPMSDSLVSLFCGSVRVDGAWFSSPVSDGIAKVELRTGAATETTIITVFKLGLSVESGLHG
jgi:hypothetical protein